MVTWLLWIYCPFPEGQWEDSGGVGLMAQLSPESLTMSGKTFFLILFV